MNYVKQLMINEWKIKQLGYDFMGFKLVRKPDMSFHHLIVPNRENGPIAVWNGAILNSTSSHPYLHTIEQFDEDMFYAITSEMIDENIKGYLDMKNIMKIYDIMDQFEKEYIGRKTKKGKEIIKPEYMERLLKR